jgi:hypothetical protein
MMYWIDKFILYAGSNLLLDEKEFSSLIGDRTFNWKIRKTIDYVSTEIDKQYYDKNDRPDKVDTKPSSGGGGGGSPSGGGGGKPKTKISEDDFFSGTSLLQVKNKLRRTKKV